MNARLGSARLLVGRADQDGRHWRLVVAAAIALLALVGCAAESKPSAEPDGCELVAAKLVALSANTLSDRDRATLGEDGVKAHQQALASATSAQMATQCREEMNTAVRKCVLAARSHDESNKCFAESQEGAVK